jgi:hypothetical protein
MDENEIERMADDLLAIFEDSAYPLSLEDALSLAQAMIDRLEDYADVIQYDMRNRRR